MLPKVNIINSKIRGKRYDTSLHGNSVSETETAGCMQFVRREAGENRVTMKSRDDSWAEYFHSYICLIKQTKFFTQIHAQKLNRLQRFKQQWYFYYAAAAWLADRV
jgi:hypothetical protein